MSELSLLEWVWTIAVGVLWLGMAVVHVASLRWGAILGISAGRHAILRKDRPTRFWVTWLVLAWPFLVLPALFVLGFATEGLAQ